MLEQATQVTGIVVIEYQQFQFQLRTLHIESAVTGMVGDGEARLAQFDQAAEEVDVHHLHRLVETETVAHPGFASDVAVIVAWHQTLGTATLDTVILALAETADTLHGVQ